MRERDYIKSRVKFRKYDLKHAAREFLEKAKYAGIKDPDQIAKVVESIIKDNPIDYPIKEEERRLAGHLFEVMLLDAVLTKYISPKHYLEEALIAKNPNEPIIDFAIFIKKKKRPKRIYQIKWSQNDADAINSVLDAWGRLSPCARANNAIPNMIVNRSIKHKLIGKENKLTKIVPGEKLQKWWEDRFCTTILPALKIPSRTTQFLTYEGDKTLILNRIQKKHFQKSWKDLFDSGIISWHLFPAYGKTILGLKLLLKLLKNTNGSHIPVVAVPRLALADQWRSEARKYKEFNNVGVEIFGTYEAKKDKSIDKELDDGKIDHDRDSDKLWDQDGTTDVKEILNSLSQYRKKIIISTYHSLPLLVKDKELIGKLFFVLADEVHHSGSFIKPERSLWEKLQQRDNTKLCIASATIPRNILKKLGLKESTCYLNLDQVQTDSKYKFLTKGSNARVCEMWGIVRLAYKNDRIGDLVKFLTKTLPTIVRNKNKWSQKHPVKILVFCASIKAADKLRDKLRKNKRSEKKDIVFAVSSSYSSSELDEDSDKPISPKQNLKIALLNFKTNKRSVQFLTNANILTEGVNIPDCNAAVILSHRSYATMTQIMGRAIRAAHGKKSAFTTFYGTTKSMFQAKQGIKEYRRELRNVISCSYNFYQVIHGTGNKNDPYTGSNKIIVLNEKGAVSKNSGFNGISKGAKRVEKEFGITHVFEPKTLSMVNQLRDFKEKFGHLRVPKDAKEPWIELGEWVDDIRAKYRNEKLPLEWIRQLELLDGWSWKVDGQTLDNINGLLVQKEFGRISGFSSIGRYHKKGLIKPIGTYPISGGGLSCFYHPKQIKDLKKKLGITLNNTKGLLNEKEFRKVSGFSNIRRYRKQELIKPRGTAVAGGTIGYFYHPKQIEQLRKKLEITLKNTKGLLSELELKKASRLSNIKSYRKLGIIKPKGKAIYHGRLSYYYHPNQIKELKKNLGITLRNKRGYLSENQVRKVFRLSNISKYRKQGLIKPKGRFITNAGLGYFYHRSQFKKLMRKLGITLMDVSGLLTERKFYKITGLSIRSYREKGLIKPRGKAMTNAGLAYYYHPKQEKELKKKLGITLNNTKRLLNEGQVRKVFKISQISDYRKKGIIKPKGKAMSKSSLSYFYHPKQVKDLKKKLGLTINNAKDLLSEQEFMKASGLTNIPSYRKKGLIKSKGRMLRNGAWSFFYNRRQIKQLKKKLGITLSNTKGLLLAHQICKKYGFTRIENYRKKKIIQPAGKGISNAGISYYYHPEQVKKLKEKLGITLNDTNGLLNETEFIKLSKLTRIATYREKGLIKPVGYGMSGPHIGPYYNLKQIKELRKKLGITLKNTKGLLPKKQFMAKAGITPRSMFYKKIKIKPIGYAFTPGGNLSAYYHPKQIKELKKKTKAMKRKKKNNANIRKTS